MLAPKLHDKLSLMHNRYVVTCCSCIHNAKIVSTKSNHFSLPSALAGLQGRQFALGNTMVQQGNQVDFQNSQYYNCSAGCYLYYRFCSCVMCVISVIIVPV